MENTVTTILTTQTLMDSVIQVGQVRICMIIHLPVYAYTETLGILCGSCVENTGVGVLSLTCLENCHTYAGIVSIISLGDHITNYYFPLKFVLL